MSLLNISLPDLLAFLLLLGFSCWSIIKLFMNLDAENGRLVARNRVLSEWLQMAELQTGIPYYSSVAIGSVPHELCDVFMLTVQHRVKALPKTTKL